MPSVGRTSVQTSEFVFSTPELDTFKIYETILYLDSLQSSWHTVGPSPWMSFLDSSYNVAYKYPADYDPLACHIVTCRVSLIRITWKLPEEKGAPLMTRLCFTQCQCGCNCRDWSLMLRCCSGSSKPLTPATLWRWAQNFLWRLEIWGDMCFLLCAYSYYQW